MQKLKRPMRVILTALMLTAATKSLAEVDLTDGLMAFDCVSNGDTVSFILIEDGETWSLSNSDVVINRISNDTFAFETDQKFSHQYLKKIKDKNWELTTLNAGKYKVQECRDLSDILEVIAQAIEPKLVTNFNEAKEYELIRVVFQIIDNKIATKALTYNDISVEDVFAAYKAKEEPYEELFETMYYEFPATLTTNLKASRRFLQVGIGISTQYDETVIENIEAHMPALTAEILATLSDYTEEEVVGREARSALAQDVRKTINKTLQALEGFGGIERVHLTSYVMQ
ncbi:flagellar basal body-associated FliL family protein [Paracoccaceae bacterium]|nr:flagellar basal body-associated FliL family protein [Paracoccaceae bacterium]